MSVLSKERGGAAQALRPVAASPPRRRWLPRPRPWWAAVVVAVLAAGTARDFSFPPQQEAIDALPALLRVVGVCVVLFGVTGLGVTRALLPASLRRHEVLWILPTGACATGLAMMLLGFCTVPFEVNLVVVMLAGLALSIHGVRRAGPPQFSLRPTLAWPIFLAALVVGVAVIPMVMREHFATVTGTGSDAHLAAGSANFLEHSTPYSPDVRLPVDQMPLLWKSKWPIYYAFGAVARLAGLETWQTLASLTAVLLAFAAAGMYVLARDLLRAGVGISACAMGFAGLDRMALHTGLNPYFNQTWGYMAMPFALLLGWWVVRPGEPASDRRGAAIMLVVFVSVVALAYPLAFPLAVVPLAVFLWRARRQRIAEGRPVPRLRSLWRGPKSLVWMVPAVLLLLIPVGGVIEKIGSAAGLLLDTNRSLMSWGGDLPGFVPWTYFLNLPDDGAFRLLTGVIVLLAFLELRRHQPRSVYIGLGIVLAGALWQAWSLRQRQYGYYFHFKLLAFIAPLLLVLATVYAGRIRRWGPWLLVAFALATYGAVRSELAATGSQLGRATTELARWADALPAGASVRLDMRGGLQLWGNYFMASHPTCSRKPLLESDYPHVAQSRKADYALVAGGVPRPAAALGPPLRRNEGYELFRLDPDLPGPDRCSYAQRSRVTQQQISG